MLQPRARAQFLYSLPQYTHINHQGLLEEDIIVVFAEEAVAGAAPVEGFETWTLALARVL